MLVVTRKKGEKVLIGDDIVVTIIDVRRDGVRVGVDAPRGIRIQRHEVVEALAAANAEAAGSADASTEAALAQALGAHTTRPAAD
jgi:carbon storage regulator